jgi:hypothetical protein
MTTALPNAPSAPIACTLGAGEYADRLAWIAELNRAALRSHRRDGLALVLDYAPDAAPRVRELVAREQACCAFLGFRVEETPAAVRLTVAAPAGAGEALDAIFGPFLTGAPGASADRNEDRGDDPDGGRPDGGRAPGVAAGTAAVAALACGVCCVLPFALPPGALAAFGGVMAAFARAYWWAVWVAAVAVVAAWGWVGWQSRRARRRPARATLRAMIVATLLLAVALSWPYVEPLLRRALEA